VAHICNPGYSEGGDQRVSVQSQLQANSSQDPISKKSQHKKRAGGAAQGVGPEFKPQYCKKKRIMKILTGRK
jgi:hypothetical protein